jgi:hypothetical protein
MLFLQLAEGGGKKYKNGDVLGRQNLRQDFVLMPYTEDQQMGPPRTMEMERRRVQSQYYFHFFSSIFFYFFLPLVLKITPENLALNWLLKLDFRKIYCLI